MNFLQTRQAESVPINGLKNYDSNSNYQINFSIVGGANELLHLSKLRFLMNLRYTNGSGEHFNNGNVALRDNTDYTNDVYTNTDKQTADSGIIQSVVFMNAKSEILEQINGYGHLMNKIMNLQLSQKDTLTWAFLDYGCGSGQKDITNQQLLNSDHPLALRIFSGITNSGTIPFSVLGGELKITLNIANPSQQIYGGVLNPYSVGGAHNPAPQNGGSKYEIRDIKCVYQVLDMGAPVPVSKNGYGYKAYSQYNQTVQSSNYQNMYNFNLSSVRSVLNTFIRSNKLNNYNANSYQSTKLQNGNTVLTAENTEDQDINNSTILKNGVRFPLDFELNERVVNEDQPDNKKSYDTLRSYYFATALTPYRRLARTALSPASENLGSFNQWEDGDFYTSVYGLGSAYDTLGQTSNFMGQNNFGSTIESTLDGTEANEIFTHTLSNKRLIPTGQGSVVLQN
jgi:hypothetical protein